MTDLHDSIALSPRAWRGLLNARVLLALGLWALHTWVLPLPETPWSRGLTAAYVVWALVLRWRSPPPRRLQRFDARWLLWVGGDLVLISLLWANQTDALHHEVLFAFPILIGALLGSTLMALGTAAMLVLVILGTTVWGDVTRTPATLFQAGLLSLGLMFLAGVVHQLASRLLRLESLNEQARHEAGLQRLLSHSVMAHLQEGVLLVDADGVIRASSPQAESLLSQSGTSVRVGQALAHLPWPAMADAVRETVRGGQAQTRMLSLQTPSGRPLRLHLRTHLTEQASTCIVFVQDMRQQLQRQRNERLAALGRLSSAVAHEIRNPLAAIAQANQLLAEDLSDPAQQRLSQMIASNAQRLAHTVDDILAVTPHAEAAPASPTLALDDAVGLCMTEWLRTAPAGLTERSQCRLQAPGQAVRFQPDHLQRVLVNLLDNAARYASGTADAIQVSTHAAVPMTDASPAAQHDVADTSLLAPQLMVWSDGAPLPAEVQAHLFEPFSSSESRSSGLGLYICQDLCARHGARIGYHRLPNPGAGAVRDGNAFVVYFAPVTAATQA